jgi:uncharacterized protein (DUF2252 family)
VATSDDERPARPTPGSDGSRFEAFRDLAAARAAGQMVTLPRQLRGEDRRIHVRQTIREDHATRIARRPEDAADKFDKLAGDVFSFFRGTALLFYRDLPGEDAWYPTVLTLGDVHPENFGVMASADDSPLFGPKDFDEAFYAPFTWDLKRGATAFLVAAKGVGVGKEARRAAARAFVRGYLDGIDEFARAGSEADLQLRLDNSPPLVRELIDEGLEDGRATWLRKYVDHDSGGFAPGPRLVPISSRREEFQDLIDGYAADREVPARAGEMRVRDVAERKGSGTASLGLTRYWILLEGPGGDGRDDVILELKQSRRSALAGLVPPSGYEQDTEAERIVDAQAVALVGGDVFHDHLEFEGESFLVRERTPFKNEIDVEDLADDEWSDYATICGRAVAQAHAQADEVGAIERDIEPEILAAVGERRLFEDDIIRFAREAAKRVRRDHASFREDHDLGAFRMIDTVYR